MYLIKRTHGRGGYLLPNEQGYTHDVLQAQPFATFRQARKATRRGEAVVTLRSQMGKAR